MINLIWADLYRLFKSRSLHHSFKVTLCIILGLTLFVLDETGTVGIISVGKKYGYHISSALVHGSLAQMLEPALAFTVITCISMLFIIGDLVIEREKTGILNIPIAHGNSREKIYFSNLLVIWMGTVGLGLLTMGIVWLSWGICFTSVYQISFEELKKIMEILVTWMIILGAMVSVWTLLATLIKEKSVMTGMGIVYIMFVSMPLLMGLSESTIRAVPHLMMMELCTNPMLNNHLSTYRTFCGIIILITALIGCILFKKQDIK